MSVCHSAASVAQGGYWWFDSQTLLSYVKVSLDQTMNRSSDTGRLGQLYSRFTVGVCANGMMRSSVFI